MEKETARSNEVGVMFNQTDRQNNLLERWRQEVFEGLLKNKRYELLIKDNQARYNKDIAKLASELKQSKNETVLANNKISVLESEVSFKEEQCVNNQQAVVKMTRKWQTIKEEN